MSQKIINGILKKVQIPDLVELLVDRISFPELQSLLMKVFELKIPRKSSTELLNNFTSSRFAIPSDIDPVIHRKLELDVFSLLPPGFELIDLSPLTPLGTTSILTNVHQNNVVSTIRNMEVAADTTNILALECARRRRELLKSDAKSNQAVRLCASQRVTRGQAFDNENFSAHFNVIALCTAGRDRGNDSFEISSLKEHISFYISILDQLADSRQIKRIHIKFYTYGGSDNSRLIERIASGFDPGDIVALKTEEDSEFGRNYYTRLRFMISVVNRSNQEFDYIDGGFTDWTVRLLGNKKERLLTSGIGTDYLLRTTGIKPLTPRNNENTDHPGGGNH